MPKGIGIVIHIAMRQKIYLPTQPPKHFCIFPMYLCVFNFCHVVKLIFY